MNIYNRTSGYIKLMLLLFFFSLASCIKKDDFQFDKIAAGNWDPSLAVPLVNSSLSINDLTGFSNSTVIEVDSNDFVYLIYKSNIYSIYGYEFLPVLNQQNNQSISMSLPDSALLALNGSITRTLSIVLPFNVSSGEQLDSLELSIGSLDMLIQSQLPHSGNLLIEIPDASLNGVPYSRTINIDHTAGLPVITSSSGNLAGYTFNFTGNGSYNQLRINYTLTLNNSGSAAASVNRNFYIDFQLNNLHMRKAFGNFGQRPFSLPGDSSRIELFNNSVFGNISIDDPSIVFTLSNSFGIPVNAQLTMLDAISSTGAITPVTGAIPNPLPVPTPSVLGDIATGSFYIDRNNSNIKPIMDQNPQFIAFDVDAISNSPVPAYNFLSDSSRFKVDVEVKLPLKGSANAFTVQDTVDFELEKINEVQKAVFRINAQNGFPADAFVQIYFTDSNYTVLDSLLTNPYDFIIESGLIDMSGRVIFPNKKMRDEEFGKARLERIYEAEKIIITGVISTQNAPVQQVPIYSNYTLNIKIGVHAFLAIEF